MSARSWKDEQLIQAVQTSKTLQEVARKLGLTTYGANSRTIKKRIVLLDIDITHFWNRKEQLDEARSHILPMGHNELFTINKVDRQYIKRTIIKNELIPYQCSLCPIIATWEDKPLSLHLDHINGISNDNRLSNLRFLCPNCHSQTSTYCGRQLKEQRYTDPRCIDCNVSVHRTSKRCKKCASQGRPTKINWLDTPTLAKMVEELGYQEVGRQLGVSGNAIKKRIRNH